MPELFYYCGGESSRIYTGRWQVKVWFHLYDGEYVWDETEPGDYVACMDAIRSFGDLERWQGFYHVERAIIEPAVA